MTIDEAIAHEREVAKEIYVEAMLCHANPDDGELDDCIQRGKYHEQLAEWLEELKSSRQELNNLRKYSYVQGFSDGYINAIDDFAVLVEKWCRKHEQYNQDDLNKLMNIAEQLKAGEENV